MSNLPNYRNGSHSRPYYSPHASMSSSDSQHLYVSGREMAPPLPPQPIEIDFNSSRTLPSPSTSIATSWDPSMFPPHGIGEMSSYAGPPNITRQLQMDGQTRSVNQYPLVNWYEANDGPFIPKGIFEAIPDDRHSRARVSNRMPMQYGTYRQPIPSDAGSYAFGATPSDSGYASNIARRSDGNASIFSADVVDRDQDLHSLTSQVADFQQYNGNDEVIQTRDIGQDDQWRNTVPSSSTPDLPPSLICPTCNKAVKTNSELKKHDLRHRKPFKCNHPGCTRIEGFSTTNDLDRHTKSKHPQRTESTKRFRCLADGCKSKSKSWPRLDNFRSHLKRVHHLTSEEEEDMVRRGETWDAALSPDQDQVSTPSQKFYLPNTSRPMDLTSDNTLPRVENVNTNWKQVSPKTMEPSRNILAPKIAPIEDPARTAMLQVKDSSTDEPAQETVKPGEVFPVNPQLHTNSSSLDNILAPTAPVSHDDSTTKANPATIQPATQPSKVTPQGKATRQEVSASETARLTEVIKTALVGAHILGDDDQSLHRYPQACIPAGDSTSGRSRPSGSTPSISSTTLDGDINSTASPPTKPIYKDLDAQKKALEVLKTLQELGYILHKDPSHSPKPQNPGSAASSKSENVVICQQCGKFKGRPCELKKHMKRHSRPYGCTFQNCSKQFGSKNDWKRHENSQHFHLETWRCDKEKPEGGICAKVCYRKNVFEEHLKKDHAFSDVGAVKNKVESCRIGRNCQARFWCGFCTELIELKKAGIEAWNERFDHIDDHFEGRHGFPKQNIQDWVPIDGEKPEAGASTSQTFGHCLDKGGSDDSSSSSGTPNGSPPDVSNIAGGSPPQATSPGTKVESSNKRKLSGGSEKSSPPKRTKTPRGPIIVSCCQCNFGHDSKNNKSCTNCNDAHFFCSNCTYERAPNNDDEDFLASTRS